MDDMRHLTRLVRALGRRPDQHTVVSLDTDLRERLGDLDHSDLPGEWVVSRCTYSRDGRLDLLWNVGGPADEVGSAKAPFDTEIPDEIPDDLLPVWWGLICEGVSQEQATKAVMTAASEESGR